MEQKTPNQPSIPRTSLLPKILVKIFILLIMAGVLLGLGFYFGSRFYQQKNESVKTSLVSPLPKVELSPSPINPSASAESGLQTLSYEFEQINYTLETPLGWQLSQEKESYMTVVNIAYAGAALIIRINNATEGSPCGFPDAPVQASEMFPDVSEFTYNTYSEIKHVSGETFRRVNLTANPSTGKSFFRICQKNQADWMQPTPFGFISYEVPYSDNPEKDSAEVLATLDAIFASLKVKS